jgi:hypothetical protein
MKEKYRKRPVIIEAEQFVVWDLKKTPTFVDLHGATFPIYKNDRQEPYVVIPTLEGQHIASHLDFIIKGIQGELYPCKPDIFEKTYEKVV